MMLTKKEPETFTYEEAAAYIEEIPKFTKKHMLEHTKTFLKRLGNPAADRKIVHVAGTNGKGSVCAYLQAILMSEGKRTGFFTSPHLVSVNERIRVDNIQIDNETFLKVFRKVLKIVRQMVEDGIEHPSYFEFLFGMGMTAFAETDVEYIILETGLGGRLDATNAIDNPALAIITSISLDHTAILGDTIEKIAGEKAGIIKPGVPVFFDGSSKKAAEVIKAKASELGVSCREVTKNAYEIQEVHRKYIAFSRRSAYDKDVIFQVPMCGCYQAMNAELALEASEYLLAGEEIHMDRWKEALAELHWEGRMERVGAHITVDGAHNPGAMEAFVESVKALDESERGEMVLLFSAVSDKKYDQMIEYLCENLDVKAYVVTQIEDERGVPAEELADVFRRYTDRPVYCKERLEDAVRTAMNERGETGEIYCLGSLYLVGMMKKLLAGGAIDA
ncbi:bifunctional folylpolyglutamate synthase/dihydrofolate synthase [Dorea longicatena]|jgi:folylpolyglutamate synthase/dihydrofolate synthase|uniref:tetrahydrofolate synthase n=1 Tax=Dorea longicatena TaxID=88431 RepID=A0A6N9JSW0_9FIRM|nr:folylpolyglutamate synthase/dihydrofolate synthase family protein [Dorea longicatena]NSK07963.1 bifunctional folylpolyglutamate synthase/dihydrofolate synthase [Blautia sp. MSK.20.9]MZK06971.1 bifunctional folylpolyglutamate synthase/dihydrofolate synthase [Dorea longicatena]MZK09264.1 bifunctional folylpolyglutamate synthase/dihydrofolate synthase [Dorea longicatena]MZK45940.1 bifunctional folylpolyglutamate synthase/dihydrofolate synthase [Dorea longicatena]NSD04149.1 bifunctional folylpo